MARGDGIDRTNARNMRLTETKIGNTQQHNEREKDSYINQDIVLERTPLNVRTTSVRRIPMSIRTLYWSGRRSMSISKPRLPGIGRCLLKWRPTA